MEMQQAMNGLRTLDQCGFKVLGVSLGNKRPLIHIAPPNKPMKGAAVVSIKYQSGFRERVFVTTFRNCLVTWTADEATVQGAA